jgi:hypothetical protein
MHLLSCRVLVAARCPSAEIVGALFPRDWARPLEFGGDVIGKRIDFIGLKRGAGAFRHRVTEITSGHIVAALISIREAIEIRHGRSRSTTLYGHPDLIAGKLCRSEGRWMARVMETADAVSSPAMAESARRFLVPDALSRFQSSARAPGGAASNAVSTAAIITDNAIRMPDFNGSCSSLLESMIPSV